MSAKQKVVELVPGYISTDTVKLLEDMTAKAKRGDIVGVTFVAMEPGFVYEYGFSGIATEYPEFALGAVSRLEKRIHKYIDEGE